jgi:DNA-binding response OmpR family regulator
MGDSGQLDGSNFQERETGKILLAEAIVEVRMYIKHLLESKGYEVYTSENEQEILDRIKEDRPDMFILDVTLPQINGLELCKSLRENQETKLLPIILLTSKTSLSDKTAGFESGADDYIIKPFHPYELLVRVKSLLAMRRLQIQITESEKLDVIRELCSALEFEISHSINTILECANNVESALKASQDPRLLARVQTISYQTSRIRMMLNKLIEITRNPTNKVKIE